MTRRPSSFFGPDGKDIVESGDPAEDKDLRAEFARSAHEKLQIDADPLTPGRVEFTVGARQWPFPVPVVLSNGRWQLDSASGRLEILARRIGRNELNAMGFAAATQKRRWNTPRRSTTANHVLKYAQKITATSGKQEWLYLGGASDSLVSQPFAEAAIASPSTTGKKAEPYHGYYYLALKSQGPDAAGGAFDYVVNGKMIGGFALIAWPAEYGVSGVGTFIINHDGVGLRKRSGGRNGRASPTDDRVSIPTNPGIKWSWSSHRSRSSGDRKHPPVSRTVSPSASHTHMSAGNHNRRTRRNRLLGLNGHLTFVRRTWSFEVSWTGWSRLERLAWY